MMLSNSLGLQAKAKKSIYIKNWDDLSFLNALDNEPVLILGAGTNVILGEYFDGTVIEVQSKTSNLPTIMFQLAQVLIGLI